MLLGVCYDHDMNGNVKIKNGAGGIGTLRIKEESFAVLPKEYWTEFERLLKSVIDGERAIKEGKARSFSEFLKSLPRRKR